MRKVNAALLHRLHLTDLFIIFRISLKRLFDNNPLVLSSSTAFFTTFSLAPVTLILISLFGLLYNQNIVENEIMHKLQEVFGSATARMVSRIINNISGFSRTWYYTLAGFAMLIFVATTMLVVVQNSINQIWGFKPKVRRHVKDYLRDRAISFFIILISGVLIMTSFLIQTLLGIIKRNLGDYFPSVNLSLLQALNEIVSFVIVVIWFAIIYRFLPAARIPWRAVFVGSLCTSILFSAGRFILVRVLPESNLSTIYGASGSYVLILLFVFYSAWIFYLGASFTRVFAEYAGYKIVPKPYAVKVKTIEVA
jgi:membrane protein